MPHARDTAYAAGGDYTNAAPGYGAVLEITTSGEPGRPIRYLTLPGQRPQGAGYDRGAFEGP